MLDEASTRNPDCVFIGKTDKHDLMDSLGLPRGTRLKGFRYKNILLIQKDFISSANGEYRFYKEVYSSYTTQNIDSLALRT